MGNLMMYLANPTELYKVNLQKDKDSVLQLDFVPLL